MVRGRVAVRDVVLQLGPDVEAELREVRQAAAILVDGSKFALQQVLRQPEAQLLNALRELRQIDIIVVAGVDGVEQIVDLPEPEDIQQQVVELRFLDLVVAVGGLFEGLRVGPLQGGLVVQPGRPDPCLHEVRYQGLDLGQLHDVVAVPVQLVPHLLAVRLVGDADLPHLVLHGEAQAHKGVRRGGPRLRALDGGVLNPLAALVAPRPDAHALRRAAGAVVLDEGEAG
mmetsp:Transcript_83657/g.240430  ORF Transcript_83657/g.240430 Transcript_83657/m.240430 type:complete len:228 (-) Transcript_83657:165-848(-)